MNPGQAFPQSVEVPPLATRRPCCTHCKSKSTAGIAANMSHSRKPSRCTTTTHDTTHHTKRATRITQTPSNTAMLSNGCPPLVLVEVIPSSLGHLTQKPPSTKTHPTHVQTKYKTTCASTQIPCEQTQSVYKNNDEQMGLPKALMKKVETIQQDVYYLRTNPAATAPRDQEVG